MSRADYITFHRRRDVCDWINKRMYSSIIAITEYDGAFTIFFYEYGEDDFIRDMEAVSCDPGFVVPTPRNVQTSQPPRTVRKATVPEPTVVY